jgi:hypothetical protein
LGALALHAPARLNTTGATVFDGAISTGEVVGGADSRGIWGDPVGSWFKPASPDEPLPAGDNGWLATGRGTGGANTLGSE